MTVQSDIGPWAMVPEWVAEALGKDLSPIILYLTLGFRADRATDSWRASRASLAEATGKSVDTIDRWTKTLTNIGALTVQANYTADGDRGWSTYIVHQARPDLPVEMLGGGRTDAGTPPHGRGSNNKNPETRTQKQEPTRAASPADGLEGFDEWYGLYPRKQARQNAATAWKRLGAKARSDAMEALPGHIAMWKREQRTIDKIPHPASWLNGCRWEDQLPAARRPTAQRSEPASLFNRAELDRQADERQRADDELFAAGRPTFKPLGKVVL